MEHLDQAGGAFDWFLVLCANGPPHARYQPPSKGWVHKTNAIRAWTARSLYRIIIVL